MNTALLQHAMVMPYFRSLCEQWNVSPLSACAKCAELQFDCFISCSSELTANSANSPPVYTRLNAAGVYSVWCKRVFGCRGMVFLKSATWFFFFFWHNESLLEKSIQTVALCISKAPRRSFKASLKKKKLLFSVALLSLELEFSLLVFCDPRPSLLLVWFGWHDTGARLCQSDRK